MRVIPLGRRGGNSPCPVNPKYTNLILGIRLRLGLGLGFRSGLGLVSVGRNPKSNPNPMDMDYYRRELLTNSQACKPGSGGLSVNKPVILPENHKTYRCKLWNFKFL